MEFSTVSKNEPATQFPGVASHSIEVFSTQGLGAPHPAEADTFDRQVRVPGHDQAGLDCARIVLVGAGGLNGMTGMGLARSGARRLTVMDQDTVERTNLPRQLFYADDLGQPKSHRLARNLLPHAIAGATITGVPMRAEHAFEESIIPADLLVVGIDNNAGRLFCSKEARARHIPAVFTMLSRDGTRCQCFLQGPDEDDPCLWCALPNLDPEAAAPCAAAIITSCFLAAAFTVFFAHRALMGWPMSVEPFNWREGDLYGAVPQTTGMIRRRRDCPICGARS